MFGPTTARRAMSIAIAIAAGAAPLPCGAQNPEGTAHLWTLRIVDLVSGSALSGVLVTFPEYSVSHSTGPEGLVTGQGSEGSVQIVATRLGYSTVDTTLVVSEQGSTIELGMERAAIAISPLTVQATRRMTSRRLQDTMFDREVVVGAIGVTREDIVAVPPAAEPDVFRSVQSSAGVASVNDFSGELFVRGGDSDQVSVLYDGAPIFGPYHLFGMFGTFNTEALDYAEFYKGSFPARYGGSLSGVLAAYPRTGTADGVSVSGGVSPLGLRAGVAGSLPWGGLRWLVGGRKASVDVATIDLPYSFHDINVALQATPSDDHRVRYSFLTSDDHYAWSFDAYDSGTLDASWTNAVSSLTWSWVPGDRLNGNATFYHSHYRARLALGASDEAPATTNRISVFGMRADATFRGEDLGGRAGLSLEGGPLDLQGSRTGAYMEGDASMSYLHGAAFGEAELWIGPLRLAPGFRAGFEATSSRGFVEPRFSARYRVNDFAVSGTVDQTYQFLSVLRDVIHHAPGAPMWFVRAEGQPLTTARGASLSVDTWRGRDWTASVTGWTRRFTGIPYWRPGDVRDLSILQFHDGSARGLDIALQKHAGRIRGWIAYQWARSRFWAGDGEYGPHWDRRHELDATVIVRLGSLSASLRGTLGTGVPFWMPTGQYTSRVFDPPPVVPGHRGWVNAGGLFTVWSNIQGRVPAYARHDVSLRYEFGGDGWSIIPYLSVINATNRPNVIGYRGVVPDTDPLREGVALDPIPQITRLPFVGFDFRFGKG